MKKYLIFTVFIIVAGIIGTACDFKGADTTLKYNRRFAKYLPDGGNSGYQPSEKPVHRHSVDLSEGPQTKYDTKLGPRDLDFDMKIVRPY